MPHHTCARLCVLLESYTTAPPQHDVHYLFGGYHRDTTSQLHHIIRHRLDTLLYSHAIPFTTYDRWRSHLHFMADTLADVSPTNYVYKVLAAWQSPINTVVYPYSSPNAHTHTNVGTQERDTDAPRARRQHFNRTAVRMDGQYGWCLWPDETMTITVSQGYPLATSAPQTPVCRPQLAKNCSETQTATGTCDFVFVSLEEFPSCTAEEVAWSAYTAGYAGVIIGQREGEDMVEVGASGSVDALNAVVTMVSHETGVDIAETIASSGFAGDGPRSGSSVANGAATVVLNYTAVQGFFMAVDGLGRLQQVGWEKYPELMMLGWSGEYLKYMQRLNDRLSAEPALEVTVASTAVMDTSQVVTGFVPPRKALETTYNTMEVDFTLECEGSRDEDCPVWDHCVTVTADCTPVSAGAGSSDLSGHHRRRRLEPGGSPNEIWRSVTPFKRRGGRWVTDSTALFPLLYSDADDDDDDEGSVCTYTFANGGGTWVASDVKLRFTQRAESSRPGLPFRGSQLVWDNPSTSFSSADYNVNRTLTVDVPDGATRVEVEALITGHGNCEFEPTSHHFIINGVDFNTNDIAFDRFRLAGTALGCTLQVPRGSLPNEHGTWYYGRNGWCDGQAVDPLVWDVTDALAMVMDDAAEVGSPLRGAGSAIPLPRQFNVTYRAYSYGVGGEIPTEDGCGGTILMSSNVAFYR